MRIRLFFILVCYCLIHFRVDAQSDTLNAPAQAEKPYVLLLSLDGFRWDYVDRFRPRHLSRLVAEGARAESMISCFPSKTFPNHYSIATGMYPARHGIVDNRFYDPDREATYHLGDREQVEDGSWYGGTPLWVLAEQNGMVAASFFFVGSEADVQGVRPSYWKRYDGSVPNETRVGQVLEWLRLPPERRPHLITMYFSDMDDAGHRFGPNDDARLGEAMRDLDKSLGRLFDGIRALDLPVYVIVVSDHGMAEVATDEFLPIEPLENEDQYRLTNNGALIHVYLHEKADLDSVQRHLQEKAEHYRVLRPEDTPYALDSLSNNRLGDLIVMSDFPYYFSTMRQIGLMRNMGVRIKGEHGFDPSIQDLHGIFYAWGPKIKQGAVLPSFENIHVYPFVCQLLGLPLPEGTDGQPDVLHPILQE